MLIENFNRNLFRMGDDVVVALSGGADSVCLLYNMLELWQEGAISTITAVHCNHGLRGEESDRDEKFCKDLARWRQICRIEGSSAVVLARLLWEKREFRNLMIYRNSHRRLLRCWIAFWYPPMDTLFIETPEIGGGLFIQHGFATMIAARSIGENCWIGAGALILPGVTIGDNVVIGAGSVAIVISDVDYGLLLDGQPTTHHFTTTEVFQLQNDEWKMIQFTFTALVH